jgi:hypothetical protein
MICQGDGFCDNLACYTDGCHLEREGEAASDAAPTGDATIDAMQLALDFG